jgi:hypothetical protein
VHALAPVDINTLSNVLVREQINDISFTIDNRLVVLIEHQSTIDNNKLKDFLKEHGSEVCNMLMTKYNREEEMEVVREEAWEDGLEKGLERGIMTTARNALAKGSTPEFVQEITGLDMAVIEAIGREL